MFYQSMPVVPGNYGNEAETKLLVTNLGAALLEKQERIFCKRDTYCIMSTNWMCVMSGRGIHLLCVSAGLGAKRNPPEARNQFMLPFDNRTETRKIADSIGDSAYA
ncbi:MAG: hypothetical protein ACLTSZ_14225 [Lachnospiraceae bacterium]